MTIGTNQYSNEVEGKDYLQPKTSNVTAKIPLSLIWRNGVNQYLNEVKGKDFLHPKSSHATAERGIEKTGKDFLFNVDKIPFRKSFLNGVNQYLNEVKGKDDLQPKMRMGVIMTLNLKVHMNQTLSNGKRFPNCFYC